MAAGKLNLELEQGAAFRRQLVYKNPQGQPVDLTGFSGSMQIRDKLGGRVYASLTSANGGVQITPTEGVILLQLGATKTKLLAFDEAIYDLFLTQDGNPDNSIRLVEGTVSLIKAITR